MLLRRTWVFLTVLAAGTVPRAGAFDDPSAYAGSERCRECHQELYEGWSQTFHATVVQNVKEDPDAVLGDFSAPNLGFTLADVEYTIGGHWDQRYMKKIGDDYYVLPKLWSVQSREWRPYNVWSWRKRPYTKYCKGCHVTAYDPKGNVTTAENRIGCEACHGPGWVHAESGGQEAIVNPAKLPQDRRDMVCAACHVRGRDPSGEYFFPVGYVPGEDLGRYYVPDTKEEGQGNSEAILVQFAKWEEKRASGQLGKCEVCGIPGANQDKPKTAEESAMDFCFGCHGFKERYEEHTRHPTSAKIACFDCHREQERELTLPAGRETDVHMPEYFLLHADSCYDPRYERACAKCHKEEGEEWAKRMVEQWQSPVEVDH